MQLRDYQQESVDAIWNYFRSGKTGNPLVALPTGTGKSIVIAGFLQSVFKAFPNQRIMMLTHVKELIEQNYSKLLAIWPFAPAGVYSAGLGRKDVHAAITFAGIASVAKKPELFGHIDLIIIDEAHLVSPNDETMYQKFIRALISVNPYLKVIGLTATPYRLGHGKLTDPKTLKDGSEKPPLFTDICIDLTSINAFNRFIAEGYLAPLIPRSTNFKLDVDGVHMRGGEFIEKELQTAVDKMELTATAVKEAIEEGQNRRSWLVFCAGIDHANNTADILNDMGVPAIAVHSKMTNAERDEAIAGFQSGQYRAIPNNGVLTTGFDHPPIDLILVLRPTASPVLWVQMLGRGTRPCEGKENCLVLDFADNTRRLGAINDPVVPRRKGAKVGEAPIKECPQCHTFQHASVRFCKGIDKDGNQCNFEFKFETKLKQGASTKELIKGDLPLVEVYKIDHITYNEHRKEGRPPMMRVTYYCGLRSFDEYVCIEHTNYAGKKARDWWRARTDSPIPGSTREALNKTDILTTPTHLRVWINKKYPEILATCFDGTAFGTQQDTGMRPHSSNNAQTISPDDIDDGDIPF